MLQNLFYLTTALYVLGVTITHLQEHKTTVTTASGNRYTVLLSAAVVEASELILVCCGWPPQTHSRSLLRCRPTAIETITADMLQTVWNELDYRVDVCRITKGAHIEHL